jgi:hypothetical protein
VAAHLGWPSVDGAIRRREEKSSSSSGAPGGRRGARRPVPGRRTWPRFRRAALRVGRARRDAARGHETWSLADLGLTEAVRAAVRSAGRVDWPRPRPRRTRRSGGSVARPPTASASSSRRPRRRRTKLRQPARVWSRATPRGRRPHHGLPRAARFRVRRSAS